MKSPPPSVAQARLVAALVWLLASGHLLAQGSLTPPGAPAPTMKALDQVEPRQPISSLPITIVQPGSYYLTKSLGGSGVSAIIVNSPDVTIDLAGFEISWNGIVGGSYVVDIQNGNDNILIRNGSIVAPLGGIVARTFSTKGLTVENLRVDVSGGTGPGIGLGDKGEVRNCLVQANGSNAGISGGASCRITHCTVIGLGTGSRGGIEVLDDSLVATCISSVNGTFGIKGGNNCVVTDCITSFNLNNGIGVGLNCRVTNCTSNGNGGHGVAVGSGGTVTDCTGSANGIDGINAGTNTVVVNSMARQNTGDGIETGNHSAITNCMSWENTGEGIRASSSAIIQGCTARANNGDGILIGDASLVRDCVANLNGKKPGVTVNPLADGIRISARNRVINCTVYDNAEHGINNTSANARNFIEGCLAHSNDSFGIALASNGNTVIKNQVGGNSGGTINQTGGNIAPIQAASDPVGTVHPLANFQ